MIVPALPFISKLDEVRDKNGPGSGRERDPPCDDFFCRTPLRCCGRPGGGPIRVTYEAQAAIEMEMVSQNTIESYPYDLHSDPQIMTWGDVQALPVLNASMAIGLKPLIKVDH